ncbi:MAG: hypothetical protein HZB76_03485 [Chlamydiae bacterium]|nr:hypothetical protein [Chlamydiota bacterium]
MALNELLQLAIEKKLFSIGLKNLQKDAKNLSQKYKQRSLKLSDEEKLAYIAMRLPATLAVMQEVFFQLNSFYQTTRIKKLLDLGSGPGTSIWAAFSNFLSLEKLTLVEQDPFFLSLSKDLSIEHPDKNKVTWTSKDLRKISDFNEFDLILLSYVMNELSHEEIKHLIEKWVKSTSELLVIIEPGTKFGFENIRAIRSQLIKNNMKIVAPCPHEEKCPMQENDWCHFYKRLERSKIHRYLKEADLGFEDEKFSYLIASKHKEKEYLARILRRPIIHKGHVQLTLCTKDGLKNEIISQKDKTHYKLAKSLGWGDVYV